MNKRRKIIFDPKLGYTEEEWRSFSKDKRWKLLNPEKVKAIVSCWQKNNRARVNANRAGSERRYALKYTFGMTEDDYFQKLKAQNGCCAICGTTEPGGKGGKHFAIDHNHKTGQVRGLLCAACNKGIGHLKDSIDLCYKAVDYLKLYLVA